MRDLDSINPAEAKPARFVGIGAIIPLFFSVFSLLLAKDAAPATPFGENPIMILSGLILVGACCMLPVPRVFRWNWEAKYFGVTLFYLGSLTLLCMTPCLCIIVYSKLSLWVRTIIFLIYLIVHTAWIGRFVRFYRKINDDTALRRSLYEEDEDAVYYMQRADKQLLQTQYKFNQFPQDRYYVIFMLIALAATPFRSAISSTFGLPFIHVFFLIGMLPISLIGAGFATRGWLVFYRYPMEIRKITGKRVYVDMSGKANILKQRKRAKTEK